MIRGIGPVYAKKLVRAFGEKVFDTIEAEPQRLREVTGIGPVRANQITGAWACWRSGARSCEIGRTTLRSEKKKPRMTSGAFAFG
jgi:hypothetical protein